MIKQRIPKQIAWGFFCYAIFLPLRGIYFINFAKAASRASPRRSLAIIIPLGSINMFEGTERIAYISAAAFDHPFKSETCIQVNLSAIIAFSQLSFLLSSETPNISRFLDLCLL